MPFPFNPALAAATASRRSLLLLGVPAATALLLASRAGGLAAATVTSRRPDDVPEARRTVRVADGDELRKALAAAQPGDHLLLEEGAYPSGLEIAAEGTERAPIVIRPRQRWGARFTGGELLVAGPHVTLLGLVLEDTAVLLEGNGARMSRCRQTGTDGLAVQIRARNITVDHNELSSMRGRGISVRPEWRDPDEVRGPRIYRNYIHDFEGSRKRENGHEGIQLGVTKRHTDIKVRAVVEHNLLERVGIDSEAISIKSSDNVVRLNTLIDCDAFLTNRHGERNRIIANQLERCRGIAVQDRDNAVLGNVLIDCRNGIRVMGGNVMPDDWPGQGTHPAAVNTLVGGNRTDGLTIGYLFRNHDVPATGTRLAEQDGEMRRMAEADTVSVAGVAAGDRAIRLTPQEVGPDAA